VNISQIIQGTLRPDGTLDLDEKPNLPAGRVQVVLQRIERPDRPRATLAEVFEEIRQDQQAWGFAGRSKEEIDAEIRALRDEGEDEAKWQQLYSQTQPPPRKEDRP
jgi:uncharacterized protein (UPF0335 family)